MNRLALWVMLPLVLVGCTLSFSNVDTHGTASDVIDDPQTVTPNISPKITIPSELWALVFV